MSTIATKGKYNIGLGGYGFMLNSSNITGVPAYRVDQSPAYGNRFAQGDRSYNDLSRWWYFAQTDWSGGITDFPSWEDVGNYYYSTNIDAYTQPGSFKLEQKLVLELDNTANSDEVLDVKTVVYNGNDNTVYIDAGALRDLGSGTAIGTTDPEQVLTHKGYLWLFESNAVTNYDGTTESSKTSQINSIIDGSIDSTGSTGGVSIGNTLYVLGRSTTDKLFCVKTTVTNPASSADWTLVFEFGTDGSTEIAGIDFIGSQIIVLLENAAGLDVFHLYVIESTTGAYTLLREFSGDQTGIYRTGHRYVKRFNDVVLITVPLDNDTGKGEIYSYDGSSLTLLYLTDDKKYAIGNQAVGFLRGGCTVAGNKAYWGNLIYDGDYFYNFVKTVDDDATYVAIPVGFDASSNELYLADTEVVAGDEQVIVYAYNLTRNVGYKTGASGSAYLVLTNFDLVSGIDKLAYSFTLNFEPLTAGQSITVEYTTGELSSSTSWTSLGTASNTVDGGTVTTKKFLFGTAVTFKKIWFKVSLASTTSGTPVVNDTIMEHLPIPNQTKTWSLNLNCANEINTLDGRLQDKTGREMRQILESLWYKKELIEYQDIDYVETLLNGSLTSSATTITVDDTTDMPEQGRITIEDEEILYTGKTQTTITGCTRGARGSTAAAHSDNVTVRTGYYKVLITDFSATIPVLQKDKEIESVVSLTLRESSVA